MYIYIMLCFVLYQKALDELERRREHEMETFKRVGVIFFMLLIQ